MPPEAHAYANARAHAPGERAGDETARGPHPSVEAAVDSRAFDPADVRRLTDRLSAWAPGASAVAVGLLRGGQRAFAVRGATSFGGGTPVDTASRFEVGSVSKTFTALLLAEQAARGELAPHDLLATLLPPGTRMPPGGAGITLTHLATHTSGLPRLPPGLLRSAGPRLFSNPYAAFGTDDVLRALARTRLRARPGTRVRYSNFGAGLLGHALSGAAAGRPYASLLAARVLDPLGLCDTDAVAQPSDDIAQVTGHWHGRPRPPFRIPGLPAAGAVRSSARDLLTLAEALVDPEAAEAPGPPTATLRAALRDVTVPRLVRPHGRGALALIWNVRELPDGSSLYHHSGGTLGHTAFVGFHPRRRTALVALANTAPGRGNALIQRAYDTLLRLGGPERSL